MQRLLLRHLVTYFVKRQRGRAGYTTFEPLVEPTTIVLSALARGGASSPEEAGAAFAAGVKALDWPGARIELSPEVSTDLIVSTSRCARSTREPAAQETALAGLRGHRGCRRPRDGRRGRAPTGDLRFDRLPHAALCSCISRESLDGSNE